MLAPLRARSLAGLCPPMMYSTEAAMLIVIAHSFDVLAAESR
jgi:hypothetical protein